MAASALLKKTLIHKGMDGRSYFCKMKKHFTMKKTAVPCN